MLARFLAERHTPQNQGSRSYTRLLINLVTVSTVMFPSQSCAHSDWIVGPRIFRSRIACVPRMGCLVAQRSDRQSRIIGYCIRTFGTKLTSSAPMLNLHSSWDNDQLYTLHTVHSRAVLCSGQKNWAVVPQFHSIF